MALNFRKHETNSEHGPHYVAIGGHWPEQRRALIENRGGRWDIEVSVHVPGKGFGTYIWDCAPTLKAAKAGCQDYADPKPVDRNSSSYTDA